jgi:hypothetical protein
MHLLTSLPDLILYGYYQIERALNHSPSLDFQLTNFFDLLWAEHMLAWRSADVLTLGGGALHRVS